MVRSYGRISSVMDVTRTPGGEWLRVQLASPAFLGYFQIMPVAGGLLVHEALLVTVSGLRVPMPELSGPLKAQDNPGLPAAEAYRP